MKEASALAEVSRSSDGGVKDMTAGRAGAVAGAVAAGCRDLGATMKLASAASALTFGACAGIAWSAAALDFVFGETTKLASAICAVAFGATAKLLSAALGPTMKLRSSTACAFAFGGTMKLASAAPADCDLGATMKLASAAPVFVFAPTMKLTEAEGSTAAGRRAPVTTKFASGKGSNDMDVLAFAFRD